MPQQHSTSHGPRSRLTRRAAQAAASQPVANETEALVGSINDRQLLIRENVVGAIITKVRIGGELARLKEVSKEEFPDWNDWVSRSSATPRRTRAG